jgi:hypothetical protein
MKKIFAYLLIIFSLGLSLSSQAQDCQPQFKKDYKLNTGSFDPEAFAKQNQTSDSAGSVKMCFLAVSTVGMSPSKVYNEVCGCKEAINTHCSLHHGDIRAAGVPSAYCEPFKGFL